MKKQNTEHRPTKRQIEAAWKRFYKNKAKEGDDLILYWDLFDEPFIPSPSQGN